MEEKFYHHYLDYRKRFIPKGLSHRKDVWSNQDIFNVFKNIINKHNWNKPTFVIYTIMLELIIIFLKLYRILLMKLKIKDF